MRHHVGVERIDGVGRVLIVETEAIEPIGVAEEGNLDPLDIDDEWSSPLTAAAIGADVAEPGRVEHSECANEPSPSLVESVVVRRRYEIDAGIPQGSRE